MQAEGGMERGTAFVRDMEPGRCPGRSAGATLVIAFGQRSLHTAAECPSPTETSVAPQENVDPAVAAFGRTLASIARTDVQLRDVLQSVVEEAAALCGADAADIAIREGAGFRMSAFTGFSPEFNPVVSSLVYSQRVMASIDAVVVAEEVPGLELKGFSTVTTAFDVRSCGDPPLA